MPSGVEDFPPLVRLSSYLMRPRSQPFYTCIGCKEQKTIIYTPMGSWPNVLCPNCRNEELNRCIVYDPKLGKHEIPTNLRRAYGLP